MGELVVVVSSLCKLLDSLISISLKPDFFRLSKLNKLKPEEVQLFWDVLHKLCCFSRPCPSEALGCVVAKAGVVAYFLSPEATSRQLLLHFGWLLSQGVIENIIDKHLLNSTLSKEFTSEQESSAGSVCQKPIRPQGLEDNPQALLQYGVWLSGRIRHNLRAMHNFRQERAHICAKIHKATRGLGGLPHLSASDVDLVTRSRPLVECDSLLHTLNLYSKWQRHAKPFWQWMESVLEEEESSYLGKPMSESDVCYLYKYLKTLEEDVRKAAMSDNPMEENWDIPLRRLCFTDGGRGLESDIEALDLKIDCRIKLNERKRKEIEAKLDNFEHADLVRKIMNMLSASKTQAKSLNATEPSVSDLPSSCSVNRIVLE